MEEIIDLPSKKSCRLSECKVLGNLYENGVWSVGTAKKVGDNEKVVTCHYNDGLRKNKAAPAALTKHDAIQTRGSAGIAHAFLTSAPDYSGRYLHTAG
jgi:hypothetical protein